VVVIVLVVVVVRELDVVVLVNVVEVVVVVVVVVVIVLVVVVLVLVEVTSQGKTTPHPSHLDAEHRGVLHSVSPPSLERSPTLAVDKFSPSSKAIACLGSLISRCVGRAWACSVVEAAS
jgi:hypothetical protein